MTNLQAFSPSSTQPQEHVIPAKGPVDLFMRAFRTVGNNRRCEERVPEGRGNLVFT